MQKDKIIKNHNKLYFRLNLYFIQIFKNVSENIIFLNIWQNPNLVCDIIDKMGEVGC